MGFHKLIYKQTTLCDQEFKQTKAHKNKQGRNDLQSDWPILKKHTRGHSDFQGGNPPTSELDGAHTLMPEAECNIFQYEQLLHSLHIDPGLFIH